MRHYDATKVIARPLVIIDEAHFERMRELAFRAQKTTPKLAAQLLGEIDRADLRPTGSLPDDVVRIGSRVNYLDQTTGKVQTIELVYPQDADIERLRVSLLTPVGAALLGLSAGQEIEWEMDDGEKRLLTVLKVY